MEKEDQIVKQVFGLSLPLGSSLEVGKKRLFRGSSGTRWQTYRATFLLYERSFEWKHLPEI